MANKIMRITGGISLLFMREGKSFIAFSPSLDLSTCGRTLEEAKKNFVEALDILFEECLKMGTLAEVLQSCGWVKNRKNGWEPPAFIGESSIPIPQNVTA
jgi:predicted RNase H-like HicB family nuclease